VVVVVAAMHADTHIHIQQEVVDEEEEARAAHVLDFNCCYLFSD